MHLGKLNGVRCQAGLAILAVLIALTAGWSPAHAQPRTPRWTAPYAGQELAVDPATQHVFVLSNSGTITVLNAQTGARVHQLAVDGSGPWGPGVIDEQTSHGIFLSPAGAQGTRITLLDTHTGAVLHTVTIAAPARFLVENTQTRRVYISGSDPDGTVTVVDANSGQVVDTLRLGAPAAQIAVDEQSGLVFVVTVAPLPAGVAGPGTVQGVGTLKIVDPAARRVIGSIPVGRNPAGLGVDASTGAVFVTSALDNTVSIVDGRNSRLLATAVANTAPADVAVDAAQGRAYVLCLGSWQPAGAGAGQGVQVTGVGMVDELDTHTGQVLLRIPVGVPAQSMALDRQTGNLFVSSSYTLPLGGSSSQTPYAVAGSIRLIKLGARPTVRSLLSQAGTTPAAVAVDEAGGRIYVLAAGSTTISTGTVAGFVSMLDESRL